MSEIPFMDSLQRDLNTKKQSFWSMWENWTPVFPGARGVVGTAVWVWSSTVKLEVRVAGISETWTKRSSTLIYTRGKQLLLIGIQAYWDNSKKMGA